MTVLNKEAETEKLGDGVPLAEIEGDRVGLGVYELHPDLLVVTHADGDNDTMRDADAHAERELVRVASRETLTQLEAHADTDVQALELTDSVPHPDADGERESLDSAESVADMLGVEHAVAERDDLNVAELHGETDGETVPERDELLQPEVLADTDTLLLLLTDPVPHPDTDGERDILDDAVTDTDLDDVTHNVPLTVGDTVAVFSSDADGDCV